MNRVAMLAVFLFLLPQGGNSGNSDQAIFIFKEIDHGTGFVMLQPMIVPRIGVQLEAGERTMAAAEVLRCRPHDRRRICLMDGQEKEFTETVLDCGSRTFAVKGIEFARSEGH